LKQILNSQRKENTKKLNFYGWDDGKIYFLDGEKEICVSDEEKLYNYFVKICTEYFTR
jgi:hypothetical protein